MKNVVLFVSDEDAFREAYADVLRLWGYEVVTASSWSQGDKSLATRKEVTAVVISEAELPDFVGRPFSRVNSGTEVLYISGYDRRELLLRNSLGENDSFLEKPFHPEELQEVLKNIKS